MSRGQKGVLTVLFSIALPLGILSLISFLTGGTLPYSVAVVVPLVFGLGYGLEAGILGSYDLETGKGWVELLVDLTWSLPNTVFGFVVGNLLYPWFGNPSRTASENKAWISFQPRGSGTFGRRVLQTLGTVNLGGAGQHERMHLLQARIFGPLYIPLVALSYVVTFLLQVLWTGTVGALLAALKVRSKAWFEPPASSAVKGFFGWIYYATPMELWAYASGNP
jgi:hypothetical protein